LQLGNCVSNQNVLFQTKKESCNELSEVQELSLALGNVTIVKKGEKDIIANADKS
jgi:hypothetical protein